MATRGKKGKFVPRNKQKYIGNPERIVYRSSWELKFMAYLDSNANITFWASEEVKIPYVLNKVRHTYYPDFLIRTVKEQSFLIEVKPKSETQMPKMPQDLTDVKRVNNYKTAMSTYIKNQAKWQAARQWCEIRGIEFVILTEVELFQKGW
jgi:hypothetical protein